MVPYEPEDDVPVAEAVKVLDHRVSEVVQDTAARAVRVCREAMKSRMTG